MTRPTKNSIRKALQDMGLHSLNNPGSLQLQPTRTGWTGFAYNACGPLPEHIRQTYRITVIGPQLYVDIKDHAWGPYSPVTFSATCRLNRQRTRWTFYYSALDQHARF